MWCQMVKTEKMESLEYSRWEISYFDVQREYSFTDEPKIRKSEFLFLDEFEFEDMALWSEFFSDSELEKLENSILPPWSEFLQDDDEIVLQQKISEALSEMQKNWGIETGMYRD